MSMKLNSSGNGKPSGPGAVGVTPGRSVRISCISTRGLPSGVAGRSGRTIMATA